MIKKIEKLKEKIKAKPKLYKTLKVVKILFNVGAYLIALFTILTLSIGGCSNSNNASNIENREAIVKKVNIEDYYVNIGVSEIVSYYFYQAHLLRIEQLQRSGALYMNMPHNTGDTAITIDNYLNNHATWSVTLPVDIFYLDNVDTNGLVVDRQSITKLEVTITHYDLSDIFTFRFYLGSYGFVCNGFYYYSDSTKQNVTFNNVEYNYNGTGLSNCARYIVRYKKDQNLLRPLPQDNYIFTNFIDAYNGGYNYGYDIGYNEGYNAGYTAGSTGASANPFDLLKKAFEGVASVLNINIIPGLSVGVFVFVPLAVVVIIAVFKLFRG